MARLFSKYKGTVLIANGSHSQLLFDMPVNVAVVGSGPAGCYLAQTLRKSLPDSELTILDKLPVPYGLVRYGVAPDHQGTKAVIKQFARLFEKDGVAFIGNIHVGRDVGLADLQELFDIVVLATGLSKDRSLGADFEAVETLYGAGRLTRLWNGHPDEENFRPEFGRTVLVIGNGNVAMDIVRLLIKGPRDFYGSDIDGEVIGETVRHVHLVGRSSADRAKFDAAMVRELGGIEGLAIDMAEALPINESNNVLVELSKLNANAGAENKVLSFHFKTSPLRPVLQEGQLKAVVVGHDGAERRLACDSIVTAIGFADSDMAWRDRLLNEAIDLEHGQLADRLYATGWFRRGPQGTIAENRADARKVATRIAEAVNRAGLVIPRPGREALRQKIGHQTTDYADWQAIDSVERETAHPNRARAKITTKRGMLALCSGVRKPA